MSDVTLEQVVQMIAQLSDEDRAKLVESLRATETILPEGHVSREMVLGEYARRLAAGAFNNVESLYGRYAKSDLDLSLENIEAAIHDNSWEDELGEFFGKD